MSRNQYRVLLSTANLAAGAVGLNLYFVTHNVKLMLVSLLAIGAGLGLLYELLRGWNDDSI